MHIKPVALALAVGAATLLVGCNEQAQQGAAQAPTVGVVTLKAEPYAMTVELPGRTAAHRIAEVRPQVDGIIQKRLFKEGSDVKEGQQLYQIDDAVYTAEVKRAEATLASARSLAQRYKQLIEDQAVSRQQYDDAEAARLQAEAALTQARINLRYTQVRAPISGRIGRSAITEGALVNNGQANALATIQQLDPIYVDVVQPVRDMLALRRDLEEGRLQRAGENAAKVELQLEDGTTYAEQGTLEFSEVSVDEGTGSVTLRAVFPNPDHLLLPGMFVRAKLLSGVRDQALLVPQQGVTRDTRGVPTALVVNAENKAEMRELTTERAVGNRWLVSEGLKPGDRVITEGLQFVRPGAEVKAEPAGNVSQGEAQGAAKASQGE